MISFEALIFRILQQFLTLLLPFSPSRRWRNLNNTSTRTTNKVSCCLDLLIFKKLLLRVAHNEESHHLKLELIKNASWSRNSVRLRAGEKFALVCCIQIEKLETGDEPGSVCSLQMKKRNSVPGIANQTPTKPAHLMWFREGTLLQERRQQPGRKTGNRQGIAFLLSLPTRWAIYSCLQSIRPFSTNVSQIPNKRSLMKHTDMGRSIFSKKQNN